MPMFSYKGYDFDVAHQPTADEFAQMSAYVDTLPSKEAKTGKAAQVADLLNPDQATKAAEGLTGTGQALAEMASGLPGQVVGGLGGLSTLAAGKGLQKAAGNVEELMQTSPFQYTAPTKAGKAVGEKVAGAMEGIKHGAGELGFKMGGELGRTNAEIAAESLMNLVEPAVGFKVGKAAIKKAAEKIGIDFNKAPEAPAAKVDTKALAEELKAAQANDALLAKLEDASLRKRAENIQTEGKAAGANDVLVQNLQDATLREQAGRQEQTAAIQKELEAKLAADKAAERPNLTSLEDETGQQSLFDQGDQMGQRNQFNAGDLGDWRIDENGMPVRVDKAMEAANVEAPLQRNLFGDELAQTGLKGKNVPLTQAIDNTPANGAWAQRRGQINRLGGRGQEMPFSPELAGAAMQAEGMKFPHIDTSMFEPKAPLPTERLGAQPPEAPRGLPEPPTGGTPSKGEGGSIINGTPRLDADGQYHMVLKDGRKITIDHEITSTGEVLRAFHDGKEVGKVDFAVGKKKAGEFDDLPHSSIQEPYQRNGIGTAMYDIAESLGARFPSSTADVGGTRSPKVLGMLAKREARLGGVEIHRTDSGFVAMKDGAPVGRMEVNMTPEQMQQQLTMGGEIIPATVDIVKVDSAVKGTGVGSAMYKALDEAYQGHIAPSGKTTPDAWKVWKRNYPDKVDKFINDEAKRALADERVIRDITDDAVRRQVAERVDFYKNTESQTGASAKMEPLPADAPRPTPEDTVSRPVSPEKIEEKRGKALAVSNMPIKDPRLLDEFGNIRTKEEAKTRAIEDGIKDVSKDIGQKQLTSGMNVSAALTNSPIFKFARTVLKDARVAAERFSRDYVTAKDGISPMWAKMDGQQRIDVISALREGDTHQIKITDEIMDKKGFTPEQKQFVNKFYEADDVLYNRYNGNLMAAGMKPLHYREGHFPGIFKGAYKSLVMDGDKVIGVIAVDSTRQLAKAKAKFLEDHPKATMVDQKRKGLADYKNQSDIFSGMNDVMQLLAQHDPKFAEVQAMVSEAIKHGNNSILGFNRHELSKKGVIGNEGNKPWKDAKENSEDAFKALVQYLEEGALHHELQQPLKDLRELSMDPDLKHLPNTMQYLDSYVKHVTGQNVSPIGRGIDAVLDVGPKLVGVGPRVPLQMAGWLKNKMSQKFMGFGNWTFMAAQLVQPLQTGLPFMQLAAGRLGGIAHVDVPRAMVTGGLQFMLGLAEQMTGKHMDMAPHMREAFKYAQDRGLLNFSEMEKAYEGNKTAAGRAFDQAAELNMKVGEVGTRTPMFMSFVDLLHKNGIEMKDAMPIAENLTQLSMIDYHQWERPQVYSKLGTIGQFAGGLTTFKHGYIGQQAMLGKNALGMNPVGKHQVVPLGMSIAAMVALAGITGAPFYDEFDNAYGQLTNTFGGKRLSIKESVLHNLPEWANSGAVGAATNVGVGSKFSSANMIPDTLAKAASPQLEAAYQIVSNAIDLAKHGDAQGARNLLQSVVPSSIAGVTESAVARDKQDYVIGKDGQRVIKRSPDDWKLREITGMRPQSEVIERETTYKNRLKQQADQEAVKKISKDFARKEINGQLTPAEVTKAEKEAALRGSTPGNLVNRIGQASLEAKKTEKQRLQGTPTTPSGMSKFKNYNPPAVNKPGER